MVKTVKGIRTNFVMRGHGELVVLLHGWGCCIRPFNGIIDTLAKKYTVAAIDMPGFGRSDDPPTAWSVGDYADFVAEFISSLEAKNVTLIGHSFGGRIIIKLSSKELPFEITRAVLVDSAGIKPPDTFKKRVRRACFRTGGKIMSLRPMRRLFPRGKERMCRRFGSSDYRSASELMRKVLVKTVNEDLEPLLSGIGFPTLIIWGKNDTTTPLSDGERMYRLIRGSQMELIDNAGHFPFLDQPVSFSRAMCSFMKIDDREQVVTTA